MTELRQTAAAMIFDPQGRMFVMRRHADRKLFGGCWDIAGGHTEPGETSEQTMRREVTEETGWQVAKILGQLDPIHWRGDDGIERVEVDYLVTVDGDLQQPRLAPEEHSEWRWITEDQTSILDENRSLGDSLIRELVEMGFAAIRAAGSAATPPA